jgi:hypothetical protein
MLPLRKFVLLLFVAFYCLSCESDEASLGNLTGKAGSMARFALNSEYLYTVDNESLNVYQLMEDGSFAKINDVAINVGIETIFATESELFIGSTNAMYIYDITNGSAPAFLSAYSHIVSCDPVVVQDTIAYVTLRTSQCRQQGFNSLDVINVKNLKNPQAIGTYTMDSPYGLGVDGDELFVCEGSNGLKVFDASNPSNLRIKQVFADIDAYDVIPNRGVLIITGSNGVYQYDYSGDQLKFLSHLPVFKAD